MWRTVWCGRCAGRGPREREARKVDAEGAGEGEGGLDMRCREFVRCRADGARAAYASGTGRRQVPDRSGEERGRPVVGFQRRCRWGSSSSNETGSMVMARKPVRVTIIRVLGAGGLRDDEIARRYRTGWEGCLSVSVWVGKAGVGVWMGRVAGNKRQRSGWLFEGKWFRAVVDGQRWRKVK